MATSPKRTAKDIGKAVAAHRARMGLTRPALAERLAIDRTYVWRIETGDALPSLLLLDKMARLFGVTLNDLRRAA